MVEPGGGLLAGWRRWLQSRAGPAGPRCVWPAGAALGETPVWRAETATVGWIDGPAGVRHLWRPTDGERRTLPLAAPLGFVAAAAAGGWLAGIGLDIVPVSQNGTMAPPLLPLPGDGGRLRLNDAGCDGAGRLWTGTMDLRGERPLGALYRVDADGRATQVEDGFTIPNGFRLSPTRTSSTSPTRRAG
jgi:sugar lactone lactonase YvrE